MGDFVEFSGEASTKPELLMSIAAQSILPVSSSGCGLDVVYLTDNTFDIARFATIIERKIKNVTSLSEPQHWSRSLLDSILEKFHLYNFATMKDCYTALVHTYHSSFLSEVGVVIIDSNLVQNFWEHRASSSSKKETKLEDLVYILRKLMDSYKKPAVFFSHLVPILNDMQLQKLSLRVSKYKVERCTNGHKADILIQSCRPNSTNTYTFNIQT